LWLFILYKIGELLSCYLPSSLAYWIAKRVGDLFFVFPLGKCKLYQRAVFYNLELTAGCNRRDKRKYARSVFRNFGSYIREVLWLGKINKNKFFRQVTPIGVENLNAALKLGKGVILASAHFGNWEWGGIAMALGGYDIYVLLRPQANSRTHKLFCSLREKRGVKFILITHLREVIRALRDNKAVAILVDETNKGINVNIFGRTITIASGPFEMAYRFGAAICPAFIIRDEKTNKQKTIVEPPIVMDYNGEAKKSIKVAAQSFAQIMEDYLRFYPDHWFLFEKKIFYPTILSKKTN